MLRYSATEVLKKLNIWKLSFEAEVLKRLNIRKLSFEEVRLWKITLTKDEIFATLKSMKNNKSSGNDGFLIEFSESFRDSLAEPF